MNSEKFTRTAFAFCILCCAAFSASAQTGISDLKPSHAAVLKNWLMTKTGWRLAVEKDYNPEMLSFFRQQEGAQARPFYAARDFNGDRSEDFAVILINRRGKYAVAVFNAPLNRRRPQTAFFSDRIESGDIVYYNRYSKLLLVGPYASDAGFMLKPRGKRGYRVESQSPGI